MKILFLILFLVCYFRAEAEREQKFYFSNNWTFRYQRNVDRDLPPFIWVWSYEPIIGIELKDWQFGVKGRVIGDDSQIPRYTEKGYAMGLFARWIPPIDMFGFKRNNVPKFENRYLKDFIANTFVSLSVEKTNIFLDSIKNPTAFDQVYDKWIVSSAFGTFIRPFKWLQIEFVMRYGFFINNGWIRHSGFGVFGDPSFRLAFIL